MWVLEADYLFYSCFFHLLIVRPLAGFLLFPRLSEWKQYYLVENSKHLSTELGMKYALNNANSSLPLFLVSLKRSLEDLVKDTDITMWK